MAGFAKFEVMRKEVQEVETATVGWLVEPGTRRGALVAARQQLATALDAEVCGLVARRTRNFIFWGEEREREREGEGEREREREREISTDYC